MLETFTGGGQFARQASLHGVVPTALGLGACAPKGKLARNGGGMTTIEEGGEGVAWVFGEGVHVEGGEGEGEGEEGTRHSPPWAVLKVTTLGLVTG